MRGGGGRGRREDQDEHQGDGGGGDEQAGGVAEDREVRVIGHGPLILRRKMMMRTSTMWWR